MHRGSELGEWTCHSCCVAYNENSRPFLSKVDRVSGRLTLLRWPPHFTEFKATDAGNHAAATELKATKNEYPIAHSTESHWEVAVQPMSPHARDGAPSHYNYSFVRHKVGLCVWATIESLDHMLFHAVPIRELWSSLGRSASFIDLLPVYTHYWPGQEPAVGGHPPLERPMTAVLQWYPLQLLAYALAPSSAWPALAARTQDLLESRKFYCYETLLVGHRVFFPRNSSSALGFDRDASSIEHAVRLAAFRRAVSGNVGIAYPGSSAGSSARAPIQIVFILRRSSARAIVNEAEITLSIRAHANLSKVVTFEALEEMPVMQQWALVVNARGIVGVHGPGLVWLAMLPSDAGRCAAIEIVPSTMRNAASLWDYPRWANANNVKLWRLSNQASPGYWRTSGNVTLSASRMERVLDGMVSYLETAAD